MRSLITPLLLPLFQFFHHAFESLDLLAVDQINEPVAHQYHEGNNNE